VTPGDLRHLHASESDLPHRPCPTGAEQGVGDAPRRSFSRRSPR
jgi:hypothetical protein